MALPYFRDDGWLPVGHHPISWEDLFRVFGGQPETQRRRVAEKLLLWRDRMRERNVSGRLILNGSFISTKEAPGDFDAIFVGDEGIEEILMQDAEARMLLSHQVCKELYSGDLLFFSATAARKYPELCRLDGFDYSKDKRPKGLVELIV